MVWNGLSCHSLESHNHPRDFEMPREPNATDEQIDEIAEELARKNELTGENLRKAVKDAYDGCDARRAHASAKRVRGRIAAARKAGTSWSPGRTRAIGRGASDNERPVDPFQEELRGKLQGVEDFVVKMLADLRRSENESARLREDALRVSLEAEISEILRQKEEDEKDRDDLASEVDRLEEELSSATERLTKLQAKVDRMERKSKDTPGSAEKPKPSPRRKRSGLGSTPLDELAGGKK
jgi:hypothetical protein